MRITEKLITEGKEYFNKTGKHLFSLMDPNGKHVEYYYVYTTQKDGEDYRVGMSFKENGDVDVRYFKLKEYLLSKGEYSQRYFSENSYYKAVRQNKYLKKILTDIKVDFEKNLDSTKFYYVLKGKVVEKSGI